MKQSGYGIASLILGIIALFTACVFVGILPALLGVIFGVIAAGQKNVKYGTAIAGLICSIIAFCIAGFFLMIVFLNSDSKEPEKTPGSVVESSIEQTEESTELVEESEIINEITETEEEYKASCQEYKYKDVLRNPEEYVGKRVKITVEISSVHEASWLNDTKYYFAYSDNDGSGYYFDDRYGIFDKRENADLKLLEDDIITVYGEISDPQYTSSLIVTSSEIFCIDMKYLDFISE